MAPAYWEIQTHCQMPEGAEGAEQLEALSDELIERGALSVTVDDPLALAAEPSPDERPIFGEPGSATGIQAWPDSRLSILLAGSEDPDAWWREASAALPALEGAPHETLALADDDWVSVSQKQFQPVVLAGRLWVGPAWETPPAEGSLRVLRVDPGQAFGTGAHPTTQLCLEALMALADARPLGSVLDVGTGSGVLAMLAAQLGGSPVVGEDIDPVAVSTASRNALLNALPEIQFCLAGEGPAGPVKTVCANILAQPLRVLAPMLLARTAPGGALILAGLLDRQADELIAHYAEASASLGLDHPPLSAFGSRDGWTCLAFGLPSPISTRSTP